MLSIWKLAVAHASYYEQAVADGREDYSSAPAKRPGAGLERWLRNSASTGRSTVQTCTGCSTAAIRGPVNGSSRWPRTGSPRSIWRSMRRSRCRSCSRSAITNAPIMRAAHDAAVRSRRWRTSSATPVGYGSAPAGNAWHDGSGFVAAAFRHRTSRAGDPHLHTHVLVANITRRPDGRWAALDGRQLSVHAKTAGYLYEAALRHEITARLGLDWGPVHNGIAELAGMPSNCTVRSRADAEEIQDELARLAVQCPRCTDRHAENSPAQGPERGQLATAQSLARAEPPPSDFDPDPTAHTAAHAAIGRCTGPCTDRRTDLGPRLARSGRAHCTTLEFDRREVSRPGRPDSPSARSVAEIERSPIAPSPPAKSSRSTPGVTPMRGRGGRRFHTPTGTTYATRELLALERRTVEHAVGRSAKKAAQTSITQPLSTQTLSRAGLADEQSDLVVELVTSGRGVDVVIAPAGAGKTTTLGCAAEAWRAAGYRVIGATLAARAARSREAARHPVDHDRAEAVELDTDRRGSARDTILVVDEAGMVGTRTLAGLLEHANKRRAKVVLVGDPGNSRRSMPADCSRASPTAPLLELETNRRQREQWNAKRSSLARRRHRPGPRGVLERTTRV